MRLTFELDENEILMLSKRIANAFVRTTGASSERDDARQDAALFLIQTDYDGAFSLPARRAYLTRRVGMILLREYQKRTGARLKTPPVFQSFADNMTPSRSSAVAVMSGEREQLRKAMRSAKRELKERDRQIVNAWLKGTKQVTIARKHELSPSAVSRIVAKFKKLTAEYAVKEVKR